MRLQTPTARTARTLGAALLASLSVLLLASPARAQATPADGYTDGLTDLTALCGSNGAPAYASLSDGSFVLFDGLNVELRASDGALLRSLGGLALYRFPSFVAIAPAGDVAYVGESLFGEIFTVDLAAGGLTPLATLPLNYDLAFAPQPGAAFVSAANFGSPPMNSVWEVDLATGQTREVVRVDGYSGPLAVDAGGGLYLATVDASFAPGVNSILRWSAGQVAGGALLGAADAQVFSAGFDGGSSLVHDPARGEFFFMDATFAGSSLYRLDASGARVETVATMLGFGSRVELVDSGSGLAFAPYQPAGVTLRFSEDDCFGAQPFLHRHSLRGARPALAFNGPGAGQTGAAAFELSGGVPHGFARLVIARVQEFEGVDDVQDIGGLYPVALRADWADFLRQSPLLALDGAGATSLVFQQGPAFEGTMLVHYLVYDAQGRLVTSSNHAVNQDLF